MPGFPDLPPLRDTIATHGLAARKSLGQHFLLDLNVTRKIAALTEARAGDTVLEVGPGPGGLTRALLETGATIVAVERDRRVMPVLEELRTHWPDTMVPVEADALKVGPGDLRSPPHVIASNLPYNISTQLLVDWLLWRPRPWRRMVLMFQREVADRILAAPGSKIYGRLSVLSQIGAHPRLGFHLPARAFTPPPKVDSSVVVFDAGDEVFPHLAELEQVTSAAFGQRRKMLRSSLKPVFGAAVEDVLAREGLDATARAENLTPGDFAQLAKILSTSS